MVSDTIWRFPLPLLKHFFFQSQCFLTFLVYPRPHLKIAKSNVCFPFLIRKTCEQDGNNIEITKEDSVLIPQWSSFMSLGQITQILGNCTIEVPLNSKMSFFPSCCRKLGGPFQGPRVGSWKLSEETCADKARNFIGKMGTWVESRKVRVARRTAQSCGLPLPFLLCWD